jgi:hypothetical protein
MITLDDKWTGCGFSPAWLRRPLIFSMPLFALALFHCACEYAGVQGHATETRSSKVHVPGHENLTPDHKFIRPQNAIEGQSQLLSVLFHF